MSDEFLKSCPFCGEDPSIEYAFGKAVIACRNKKCDVKPSTWLSVKTDSVKRLINAWNTRKDVDNE